jgi:hypothetical protein
MGSTPARWRFGIVGGFAPAFRHLALFESGAAAPQSKTLPRFGWGEFSFMLAEIGAYASTGRCRPFGTGRFFSGFPSAKALGYFREVPGGLGNFEAGKALRD